MIKLFNGDCLEVMDTLIKDGVQVDAVICDPPYGTTQCKCDSVIPFEAMWQRLNKLIKPNGAIVLFGSESFSSALRMSNIKNYKYDWVWKKNKATQYLNAKKMPLNDNELISLFYKKPPTYNPQMDIGQPYDNRHKPKDSGNCYGNVSYSRAKNVETRYPQRIISFNVDINAEFHPTQKPVALMEYLIKTYTNEGEIVLDFTAGSGSTGVAAIQTGRKFIGIELDAKYFRIAKERIESARHQPELGFTSAGVTNG